MRRQRHRKKMVRATLHYELEPSQRLDLIVSCSLLSIFALQFLLSVWSAVTILAFVAALVITLSLLLSPLYSSRAYQTLRLSRPLTNYEQATIVQFQDSKGKAVYKPLSVREDTNGNRFLRIEHESRFYEADALVIKEGEPVEFVLITSPVGLPLQRYVDRVTEKDTRNASKLLQIHGENKFDIPLPEVRKLVAEQAQSPFFLFQVFCVTLWMLDEYWYFALFTLVMLVMFELVVAQNRLRNIEVARQMLRPDSIVWVRRAGSWRKVNSSQIVPLDVIAVGKDSNSSFPCDALLIHGSCVVNEAMLTGESTPKMKDCVTSDGDLDLSSPLPTTIEDSRFVILGGTTVLETRAGTVGSLPDTPEDNQAIAVVLRTGYETTQGSLMRVILHAGERVTVDSNREAYAFMLCLVVVATIAAGYVLVEGLKDPNRSHWKLFLHCIMIVTSVVPPELPMELSLAVTTSLSNLITKHAVYCTEPYRIPLAGMIDVCCFDKTGTLTSDDLTVKKVVNTENEDVSSEVIVHEILALCQSLVYVEDQVAGDSTETAAWRFVSSRFRLVHDSSNIGLSRMVGFDSSYSIVKRFPFDSTLRRMSVVCLKATGSTKSAFVFAKGAPETMIQFLSKVPSGYKETYEALAAEGCRVLALASKRIDVESMNGMDRKHAEQKLIFEGFLALDSPLKVDSIDTVKQLRNSGHRVIIITGDSETTAREVGKKVGVTEGDSMTGLELASLLATKDQQEIRQRIGTCSIFARVSPAQKEKIISVFSEMGLVTLMCGDGTNDAGALKRADVGVSVISHPLLERVAREDKTVTFEELMDMNNAQIKLGDASIASPFTAKTPQISVVLDIVRQGRCTLVTTVQMFKILAVNGLVHSITMTVLYLWGVRQGDTQSTIFGIIVAVIFALLSFTQPQKQLTSRRPVSRIFSKSVIASIMGQSLVHLCTLFAVCSLADLETTKKVDPDAPFEPNVINSLVYITGFVLQANVFAVNYRGHPFMTPFFENKMFASTICFMYALAALLAGGWLPSFIQLTLELVELPGLYGNLISYLVLDTTLAFVWEVVFVRSHLNG